MLRSGGTSGFTYKAGSCQLFGKTVEKHTRGIDFPGKEGERGLGLIVRGRGEGEAD